MAHDPARAVKRTLTEARDLAQAQCREHPCLPVEQGKMPPCVVCVHEGKIRTQWRTK
jgi:hypothetical protein